MQRRAGTGPVPALSVALTVMSFMVSDVSYVLIMCFEISKIILMTALVFVFLYQIYTCIFQMVQSKIDKSALVQLMAWCISNSQASSINP